MVYDDAIIIELGEVRSIPRHVHDDCEIFYLLKGAVQLDYDGTIYQMGADDIILCNPGEVHGAQGDGPNIMFRLIITKAYLIHEVTASNCWFVCNSCRSPLEAQEQKYDQLRQMLKQLMFVYYKKEQLRSLEIKASLLQMLSFLLRNFLDVPLSAPSTRYDENFQSILQYIHQNYRSPLSLQAIADQKNISIYQLSRIFKKKTGIGFIGYVHKVRLAGAVNDLLHSNDSIMKIALNNGFSNVGSLNRLFQKTYGDTPAKYRAARHIGQATVSMYSELAEAFPGEKDLIKYLRQFDTKYEIKEGKQDTVYVNVCGDEIGQFHIPQKIVRVGRICELLKREVQQELDLLREKTAVDYVHFSCLYDDGMYDYRSIMYANYEY